MSFQATLKGVVAQVVGGVGNVPGAIAGSLLLGLVESYGIALFGTSYRNLFAFVLLVVILVLRPNGLFAGKRQAPPEPMTGTFIAPSKPFNVPARALVAVAIVLALLPLVLPNPYVLQILTNCLALRPAGPQPDVGGGHGRPGVAGPRRAARHRRLCLGAAVARSRHAGQLSPSSAPASSRRRWARSWSSRRSACAATISRSRRLAIGEIVAPGHPQLGEPDARADRHFGHPVAVAVRLRARSNRIGLLVHPGASWSCWRLLQFRLLGSHLGRVLRAVRDDDVAARSYGIRLDRYKALAFTVGGFAAGVSGGITAHIYSYINHETFNSQLSILALTIVILGGMGNVDGRHRGLGAAGRPARSLPRRRRIPRADLRPRPAAAGALPPAGPDGHDMTATLPLLEVRGLTRRFGGLTAVDDVDLDVAQGEFVSIIGPNGAGKTTLFNLVTGLDEPDAGTVAAGRPRHHRHGRRKAGQRSASRAPSSTAASSPISACSTTCWWAPMCASRPCGRPGPVRSLSSNRWRNWRSPWFVPAPVTAEEERLRDEALKILGRFGDRLLPRKDNPAYSLSYANRRRVEIARALALGPRLLLLDEPTAGMNQTETAEMQALIGELKQIRPDDPADRAQARHGDAALGPRHRHGRGRRDRRRQARRGAQRSRRSSRPISAIAAAVPPARAPSSRRPNERPDICRRSAALRRRRQYLLRSRCRCISTSRFAVRTRPDRLPAGRQCQRQVDDHEDHPRAGEAGAPASSASTASRSPGCTTPQIVRRGVGSVPEARRLFGDMSVRENLLMGAFSRKDQRARLRRISIAC